MPFTYGVYDDSVHDCDNDSTPDGLQSPAPSCSFVTMFATAINSPALTVSDLHEDGVTFNIADILAGPATNKRGFMATGGSYLDGNAAGVWAFETVPEATTRPDVGMRCIIKVGESNYQN